MGIATANVEGITWIERLGMFRASVTFQIEDGELYQNISVDLRVAGNRKQTLEETEELALQKAKSLLSEATRDL